MFAIFEFLRSLWAPADSYKWNVLVRSAKMISGGRRAAGVSRYLAHNVENTILGSWPRAVSAAQINIQKNVTFCIWLDSFIVEVIISKGDGSAGMLTGEIVTQPEFSSTLEYDRMQ